MKKVLTIAALVAALFFRLEAQTEIKLAPSTAAGVDGKLETEEWKDASVYSLTGGGNVYLKYDGSYVYAAVRGPRPGWTHLYLSESDEGDISVLHASAALGKVVYRKGGDDLWQPLNEFTWELRDRVYSDDVRQKMADYLNKNYWTASNNNLGNKAEVEFQIKLRDPKSRSFRLAIVYAVDRENRYFFPNEVADDTLKPELVAGNKVENVKFDRRRWARITLENRKAK